MDAVAVCCVVAGWVLFSCSTWAGNGTPKTPEAVSKTDVHPQVEKASKLIGMAVQNNEGEKVGKVEELVLDAGRQRVSYAALSFGGILGVGDKYFAIPWPAFEYQPAQNNLLLNISKSEFESASGFDKENWPDMGNPKWDAVHPNSISDEMIMESTPAHPERNLLMRRLSKVMGSAVKNYHGEDLGRISDVAIALPEGRVSYGVLAVGGFLGMDQRFVAVPWEAIELLPGLQASRVDADKKTLGSIAFTREDFPQLTDAAYNHPIQSEFAEAPTEPEVASESPERPAIAAWEAGSPYNQHFNPDEIETIVGTVKKVGDFYPARGAVEGLQLSVKTDAMGTVKVDVGPVSFVQDRGFDFSFGDRVTVIGAKIHNLLQQTLMASEITKDNETLKLRDEKGVPLWTPEDLRKMTERKVSTTYGLPE